MVSDVISTLMQALNRGVRLARRSINNIKECKGDAGNNNHYQFHEQDEWLSTPNSLTYRLYFCCRKH